MQHPLSLQKLQPSSSQVLPPPLHDRLPTNVRDPEFYQFDRGDQKRGGRENNEKYGRGKGGEEGEKGVVVGGGGGVKEGAGGQMTRPTGSPFYSDFLLEEEVQQGGIRGRRKYSSSQPQPINPPSIFFPEKPFKEPQSPVQLTAKAEGGFWNSNLDDVDSAWKPSLTFMTPTTKESDNDQTEAVKIEWEKGEDLRQYVKEGGEENMYNFGYNDVMNKNNEKKEYTEKEGEDFDNSLSTLFTGDNYINFIRMVQNAHSNFSDDPYERDFEPHRQPGPPYYTEDYSIYEYSYDDEEPYSTFADDYGTGSPFYPENMVDSYPQYADYFDQKEEVVEDVKPMKEAGGQKANGASDADKKQATRDIPSGPTLEDTENLLPTGHNSESFQDRVPVASNDDSRRSKENDVNVEPGVDHYPHNTYR